VTYYGHSLKGTNGLSNALPHLLCRFLVRNQPGVNWESQRCNEVIFKVIFQVQGHVSRAKQLLAAAGNRICEKCCFLGFQTTPWIFFRPTPLGFRQVVQHVQLHVA